MTSPYLTDQSQLFIGGEFVEPTSKERVAVVSPSTEEALVTVPAVTEEDIARAVEVSRAAFEHGPWPRLPVSERIEVLRRLADSIEKHAQDMIPMVISEIGSPVSGSGSSSVLGVPRLIRAFADMAERFPYVEHRNGAYGNTLVVREPVGVVGSIIPWNGALFESLLKMAPALLAGCTGVIKLPIETPLDGYALADCFVEAGLPKGVISILTADRDVSESLVRNPQIDKISFTGSTAVGRRIGSICGGDLRRFTLELGGKSAAILLEDGNLELAYGAVKASALGTNGQQCFALTRVLVPQSRYAEAVDFFAAKMSELTVGDPFDPATDIGPLITGRQRDRVKDYVRSARDEGARIVVGGDGSGGQDRGWFVEPTLIADATPTMRVVREEIFGPVISVLPFLDEDDAIRLSNDSEYGLNGAVFTSDQDHGIQVGRQIRSGIFTVNGFRMNWEAPFGGFKSSGIGREYGPEGLAAWTELKSINLVDAT